MTDVSGISEWLEGLPQATQAKQQGYPLKIRGQLEPKLYRTHAQGNIALERSKSLNELAGKTNKDLRQMAWNTVVQGFRGQQMSAQQMLPYVDQEFQKLVKQREVAPVQAPIEQRKGEGQIEAVEEALKRGAAPLPGPVDPDVETWGKMLTGGQYTPPHKQVVEEIRRTGQLHIPEEAITEVQKMDRIGPPSKEGSSWLATVGRALDKPSRLAVAAITGAMRGLGGATEDVPMEAKEAKPFEELEKEHGPVGARLEVVKGLGEFPREYGVPMEEAWDRFWSQPEVRGAVFESIGEHLKGAWQNKDPEGTHDLSAFVRDVRRKYRNEAIKRAVLTLGKGIKDLGPDAANDMILQEADEIYVDLIRGDKQAGILDSPLFAQLGAQFWADPLWVATPAKVAKLGVKALRAAERVPVAGKAAGLALKGGKAAKHGLLSATERVRYMGPLWELEQKGSEGAKDLAALLRSAHLRSGYPTQLMEASADLYLKTVKKIPKEYKALFFDAMEGRIPVEEAVAQIPNAKAKQKFLAAVEDYPKWREVHETVRDVSGIGQFVGEDGKIAGAAAAHAENYVPHRIAKKPFERQVRLSRQSVRREKLKPGSSMARAKDEYGQLTANPDLWEKDVYRQAMAETYSYFGRAATKARELRMMSGFAKGTNLAKTGKPLAGVLEVSRKTKLPKLLPKLEKKTGVEWALLEDDIATVWKTVTGTPGAKVGDKTVLVPKAMKSRILELSKVVANGGSSSGEWMESLNKALNWTLRPVNRFGRYVNTVPNFMFAPRNAAGALTLGYLAHGAKVLDPTMQKLVMETAVGMSYDMPKEWLAKEVSLLNGAKVTRSQLIGMAREDMGSQLGARLSSRVGQREKSFSSAMETARDFPQQAAEAVGKRMLLGLPIPGPRQLSAQKMAELTENYQHLLGYVPGLEGVDDLSRANALDFMAKNFGDYRQMSKFEKNVMNEGIFFYTWVKFVSERTVKGIINEPRRVAEFQKLKNHFERSWGAQVPAPPESFRSIHQSLGFTAPPETQPPERRRKVSEVLKAYSNGKAELPPMGSDAATMMMMDEPLTMGLYWVNLIEGSLKGGGIDMDDDLFHAAGPASMAAIGMLTGMGPKGEDLPRGEIALGAVKGLTTQSRPAKTWRNAYRLLFERGLIPEAIELGMRRSAVNDLPMLGLVPENLQEEYFGGEMKVAPGWPLTRAHMVYPTKKASQSGIQAIEKIPERGYQIKKAKEW